MAEVADPATAGPTGSDEVASRPRGMRAAQRMPSWLGSIRFRLAFVYSSVLFAIAALMLAGVYLAVARSLDDSDVYETVNVTRLIPVPGATLVIEEERQVRDELAVFEREVNQQSLNKLRRFSFTALGVLFVTSLGVGWVVAGQLLRPLHRITAVAKDIQATDLSRRIDLDGPADELTELADTFDDMLGRLDDAFESQRQFIHEASHELRNPLAVIRTNLDVALSDPDASTDDLRDTLEVVHRASDRMGRLVDDLLVYARRGQLSPQREVLDLAALVGELVEEYRAPAAARDVLVTAGPTPGGLLVEGDRHALRQAVANLLANAVRLSPPASTVTVSAGRHDAWVWLAVTDEGPGIDPADHERVFQRFWRGDPGTARSEARSGLGLTIVRQVAESHGGEVKLVSERGRGATFAIWLPAVPA